MSEPHLQPDPPPRAGLPGRPPGRPAAAATPPASPTLSAVPLGAAPATAPPTAAPSPAEAPSPPPAGAGAPPRRPRASIVAQLWGALGVLAVLVAALGALTVWGTERALEEVAAAEHSLVQIESARAMEAAFNRYLLGEIGRRLGGSGDPAEDRAAGALRGALLTYRVGIAREIETARTDAERDAERAEMVRAATLSTLFETIETEAMFDRVAGAEFEAGRAARAFADGIAAGRDTAFRAVVAEILSDERDEAVAAFAGLDRLRRQLALAWGGLAIALVAAAAVFTLVFYRRLMRPIAALARAAEALGTPGAAPAGPMPAGPMPAGPAPAGAAPARVPEALPGEFATLARRFNAMAERIETEQSRLQAVVAQRTAALEAANAELRRVDATRRRFFASVSHELRTPVTVLLGEAQLALRCPGEEVIALERIAASGGYLRRRLDDLMRLARSEDGQLALRMREADLAAALEEAVTAASAYATANEIVLDGPAPGSAPGGADWQVLGDADALTQIALALIDNAVKFSPPGGRVAVSLWRDAGAGAIGFEIADRGPGFEGDPAALFERYAQESAGRRSGGAGLGLAIVRWVAEAHGGSAGARNRAGGGAVLRVALPLPGAAP